MPRQFYSKLAGVTAFNEDGENRRNRQTILKQFVKEKTALFLKREPYNLYDKNAIAVYVRPVDDPWGEGNYQIGYLNKKVAAELAPLMDNRHFISCFVTNLTGDVKEKDSIGVNVLLKIYTPQEVAERRRNKEGLKNPVRKEKPLERNASLQSSIQWKEFLEFLIAGMEKIWNSGKAGKISLGCSIIFIISLLCGSLSSLFPASSKPSDNKEQATFVAFTTQLALTSSAQAQISQPIINETPLPVVMQDTPIVVTPTLEIPIPDIPEMACIPRNTKRERGVISSVVDGDTVHILIDEVDYALRYIGMDAPESTTVQEYYGPEATSYNQQLVEGRNVILVNDVSETDMYGRLLRYVIVDNRFVNYELVKLGYAVAQSYPPDTACDQPFQEAHNQISATRGGLWSYQPSATPAPGIVAPTAEPVIVEPTVAAVLIEPTIAPPIAAATTVSPCLHGCTQQLPGCLIKGNINNGERIYHVPGDTSYSNTKITPENGEKWFCTEAEALANGWRPAYN